MRAIDVDALIEFIENRYEITWKNDYEGGIKDACTDILEKISKMPTIEPERKKGKWIKRDVPRQIHGISCSAPNWQCSVCKKWWFHNGEGLKWYKFCPECGADMRGDDHDL